MAVIINPPTVVPRDTIPANVVLPTIAIPPNIPINQVNATSLGTYFQALSKIPAGYRLPNAAEVSAYVNSALSVIRNGLVKQTPSGQPTLLAPAVPGETQIPAGSGTTVVTPPPAQVSGGGIDTSSLPFPIKQLVDALNLIIAPAQNVASGVMNIGGNVATGVQSLTAGVSELIKRSTSTAENVGAIVQWIDQPRTWIRILLIIGGLVVTLIGVQAFVASFVSSDDVFKAGKWVAKRI